MTIKKRKIIIITALLIGCAVIFFIRHEQKGKIFLHAVPVQTHFGWGYNIMADDKIYIHQEYMPAVSGKQGFKSPEDALRVGRLVVQKISSNQLPTITEKDLQDLGLLK